MKTINLCFSQYEITLLTKEEYMEYRNRIPIINDWWWLRSPGDNSYYAAFVYNDGSVRDYGYGVYNDSYALRPAIKTSILNFPIGECFIALGNRWVMIDDGMAVSQDVITHRQYDPKSNVWETSKLKQWLEEWAREGES